MVWGITLSEPELKSSQVLRASPRDLAAQGVAQLAPAQPLGSASPFAINSRHLG